MVASQFLSLASWAKVFGSNGRLMEERATYGMASRMIQFKIQEMFWFEGVSLGAVLIRLGEWEEVARTIQRLVSLHVRRNLCLQHGVLEVILAEVKYQGVERFKVVRKYYLLSKEEQWPGKVPLRM